MAYVELGLISKAISAIEKAVKSSALQKASQTLIAMNDLNVDKLEF